MQVFSYADKGKNRQCWAKFKLYSCFSSNDGSRFSYLLFQLQWSPLALHTVCVSSRFNSAQIIRQDKFSEFSVCEVIVTIAEV